MFRITEDPSSGSLVQCLAKIINMAVSCPLTWTDYAAITPTTSMSTDTIEPFL